MRHSMSTSQPCSSTDTSWNFYTPSSTSTEFSSQSSSNSSTQLSTYYFSSSTQSRGYTPELQAYTFATSSPPPAYESIPPLEEYDYGNPPPIYGFPSRTQSSRTSFSEDRFSTLSTTAATADPRHSTELPALYDTTSSGPNQMLNVAPVPRPTGESMDLKPAAEDGTGSSSSNHTTLVTEDTVTSHKLSPTVDPDLANAQISVAVVTMISLIAGQGMRTTVLTIQQQQEASETDIPSLIALNDPGANQTNRSKSDEESTVEAPDSSSSEDGLGALSTESPLSAILMGRSRRISSNPVCVWAAAAATAVAICISAGLM